MSDREPLETRIPPDCSGLRLDQALVRLFPQYSRSRLSAWIRDARVRVDGEPRRPRDTVRGGERISLLPEPVHDERIEAEAIPLDIVYEDAHLLVVNKPPGMVVHPGAGNPAGTLQNALLHHAPELEAVPRAGLVHRLDKDTSGLLVVARSLAAHKRLVAMMAAREIGREYEAVVCGLLTGGGSIDAPIGRHAVDRKRMAVRESGREAVTHYRLLARFRGHSHVAVRLETGRTHQIRVHFAHIRHPLVGDPTYGRRPWLPRGATAPLVEALGRFRRQALHARRLSLAHPVDGRALAWEAPTPGDLQVLLDALAEDLRHAG